MVIWCYALRPDCSQLSNGIALSQVIRTQLSDTLPVHSGIAHFQFTMASCAKAAVGHITNWKLRLVTARCLLFLDAGAFFCGLNVLYSLAKAEAYIYMSAIWFIFMVQEHSTGTWNASDTLIKASAKYNTTPC